MKKVSLFKYSFVSSEIVIISPNCNVVFSIKLFNLIIIIIEK